MEKVMIDITKYFGWIYLFLFLIVFILLISQHFIKAIYHFKLLKIQYPKQLENISSYFSFMMITIITKINFRTLIWFWTPFYYNYIPIESLCKDALEYHRRLKKVIVY